jgi:CheY-like chemotaxis protein
MFALLEETGLSREQQGYTEVLRKQLSEIRRNLGGRSAGSLLPKISEGPRVRVLVVDDDEMQRLFITRNLSKAGVDVTTAKTGAEAVKIFTDEEFDLIVMDCQMPGMDGFEVTRKIRELEGNSGGHVSIVAYTGHHITGYMQLCLQSGMDAYLKKPLPSSELVSEILRIVREGRVRPRNPHE